MKHHHLTLNTVITVITLVCVILFIAQSITREVREWSLFNIVKQQQHNIEVEQRSRQADIGGLTNDIITLEERIKTLDNRVYNLEPVPTVIIHMEAR